MIEAPVCPDYFVESVDEHSGKPCVLIRAGDFYYLLTNIDVGDGEVEYDLAVGRPVATPVGAIEWIDDSDLEGPEDHGMIADLIVADVIQSTTTE